MDQMNRRVMKTVVGGRTKNDITTPRKGIIHDFVIVFLIKSTKTISFLVFGNKDKIYWDVIRLVGTKNCRKEKKKNPSPK